MPESEENKDVHTEHCCVVHGCKYGDDDCTVFTRQKVQSFGCEDCDFDGIKGIPDPNDPDFDILLMTEWQLRDEAKRMRKLLRELDSGQDHDRKQP